MGQTFKEVAHLRTNIEKYHEGYERIYGKRENEMDDANKLLPCPFCGSNAEAELAAGYAPEVACTNNKCGVYIMDIHGVWLDEVVKQWNTRTTTIKQGS